MKRKVALALAGALGAFGFWLGEGATPPWSAVPVAVGVIGCVAVTLIASGKLGFKSLLGAASLALYATAFIGGSLSFSRAFNECVERGEEVRVQLSDYHQGRNQYPEHLSQLEGFGLCRRIARPTVLKYERTKDGYVLSFKDWLVEHSATESEPFTAHK